MSSTPSRSTILIVDDEPDLREVVAELLEMEDYTVLQAANGQAALDVLAANNDQPCLVLLDLMMPVMDGHEFLHRLREDARYRELPVLMLTAHFSAKAPPGTVGLLRKPVDIPELLAMVARHCPAAA
ncbi:response regulator [Corallococcus sp. AB004]|uniref:response regulator n=1 Tax=Corallococcus TaxID=83461 RepID=UPI000EA29305|nr:MULTISPECIES: response regulator [unclassified Corallococcus]NPC75502.1 response regulator [Corallococcus exiguus]RKI31441.1 response regulator [Corallococcus sp. AB004]NPD26016.1 response regulator [Corallococcus exiguus]NRD49511.1 response regulator [Corallococcus exiguus]RKG61886.1 response regulator [Corallococcus sp. AB011P]